VILPDNFAPLLSGTSEQSTGASNCCSTHGPASNNSSSIGVFTLSNSGAGVALDLKGDPLTGCPPYKTSNSCGPSSSGIYSQANIPSSSSTS